VPAGYTLAIVIGGIAVGTGLAWRARLLVPVALGTMHLNWGVGFLTSPARLKRQGRAVAKSREAAG
jgi:hypothetical protein